MTFDHVKVHEINKVTDFSNPFLKANYRASCYFFLQWASRVLLQQDREIKSKLSAEYSDCIFGIYCKCNTFMTRMI